MGKISKISTMLFLGNKGGCPRVPHLSRGFNDHHVVLSSEVVREKHGRVSSRGDSLKLSVLLFRGNTVG